MRTRLLLSAFTPLAITGGAILLRSVCPKLDASVAIYVAGLVATFVALTLNCQSHGPKQ